MAKLEIRKFPFPYKSMLSICSDLDETPGPDEYFAIGEFLNTSNTTKIGTGVNLEIGNTLYFDMPENQFSYWNADAESRERIHALIRSGHIDCFHSFGDLAITRQQILRSLDELEGNDCRIRVWVDHAQAVSNFGADIMMGRGDMPASPVYHSDRTIAHGVRYVWTGRVTSMIGQNAPYRLLDMFNRDNTIASVRAAAKDVAKKLISIGGGRKYRFHKSNNLIRNSSLRDGQKVIEFMRCNPHPNGVSGGDNSRGIADVLSVRYLDRLIRCGGCSVIYTHLGKLLAPRRIFCRRTKEAFELLSSYSSKQMILVTTTRRLLDYVVASSGIVATAEDSVGEVVVNIQIPKDCSSDGVTFYWDQELPDVYVNGVRSTAVHANPPDNTGRRSVSLGWPKLHWVS